MDGKLQWRLRRGDTSHQAQYGDIQPQYGHFGLSVTSEPKREPGNHHHHPTLGRTTKNRPNTQAPTINDSNVISFKFLTIL